MMNRKGWCLLLLAGMLAFGSSQVFAADLKYNALSGRTEVKARIAAPAPEFKSKSLNLKGLIGVNFFMDLSALTDEERSESYMAFTVNGKEQRADFDPSYRDNTTGNYYGFTCFVNSVQMADKITAEYHYGENGLVSQEYSVKEYIEYFDTHSEGYDQKTLALIKAIADYGYHAQPFLASVNGWTVGTDHAAMNKYYAASYDLDAVKSAAAGYAFNASGEGLSSLRVTYRLYLDSETTLDVFLAEKAEGTEVAVTSAVFDGKTYNAEQQSDGRYLVRIPGIAAHKLGDPVTITGTAGGEAFTVSASALSYAYTVLSSSSTGADAKNAMAALYEYHKAADAYLGT